MNPPLPDHIEVTVSGQPIRLPIVFEYSPAARRLRLSLKPGPKARVVLPAGVRPEAALRFVGDHRDWLAGALRRLPPPGESSVAEHLAKFPWVSAGGKFCVLEAAEAPGRPFLVHKPGEELVVFRHRPAPHAESDLLALLRRLAADTLPGRTAYLAEQSGVPAVRVSIRDQRGRWGSCSTTGTVSLNWRLVLLPPALQDHVIFHELAHVRHMNHSDRFWAQLAAWDPDWKSNDRSLTKDWGRLMDLARDDD